MAEDFLVRVSNPASDFEPGEDGFYNAEAVVRQVGDGWDNGGYVVEWWLTAVGQVTTMPFGLGHLGDAYKWLEENNFE